MKRQTRQMLRAARFLEQEAEEYVQAGKETKDKEEQFYFGLRAKRMFGVALSLREMAKTGNYPTRKSEDALLKQKKATRARVK